MQPMLKLSLALPTLAVAIACTCPASTFLPTYLAPTYPSPINPATHHPSNEIPKHQPSHVDLLPTVEWRVPAIARVRLGKAAWGLALSPLRLAPTVLGLADGIHFDHYSLSPIAIRIYILLYLSLT
ncbi:uncharacterized protein IWZ02DRAFT_431105 [Phyllosticta citriasiana]|uniref:uncharacterized protein n=1 Tax=Phyllosticta citriasiana TaxID=595635 RepID=UPI0030FD581D